jgi:hypothetical protein
MIAYIAYTSDQLMRYEIYLECCEDFDQEPLSYDEWQKEDFKQRAEMYGD